jgi:hypothetical protein
MNNAHTTEIEYINEGAERHGFGVIDRKGRELGARVHFSVRVYDVVEGHDGWTRNLKPGTYYAWCGHATRAGEAFGALQPIRFCKSEAERQAAVAKYLAGAAARALKWQGR